MKIMPPISISNLFSRSINSELKGGSKILEIEMKSQDILTCQSENARFEIIPFYIKLIT